MRLFGGGQWTAEEQPAQACESSAKERCRRTRAWPRHEVSSPETREAFMCGNPDKPITRLGTLDGLAPFQVRMRNRYPALRYASPAWAGL